jgi:hypothetical protein
MSTDSSAMGLRFWIPELVAALDTDRCGAGVQLWSAVVGRSARITLDDDTVFVRCTSVGRLEVRSAENGDVTAVDGEGSTTTFAVHALLDGEIELNQAVVDGRIDIRSSIDDALWMYRVVELLLDGSSRVPRLRELKRQFYGDSPSPDSRPEFTGWVIGASNAERSMLERLGLTTTSVVDHDA